MSTSKSSTPRDKDENRDPISGEPGSHPIGTGLGAAGAGAATGALGGAVAGPIGAAVGAVVGAVAGGLAGKGIAESIDPTAEDAYWGENYASRPYVEKGHDYDQYRPAYQQGWEAHSLHADKSWDEIEAELGKTWDSRRGNSKLDWNNARHASRDAWEKIGAGNRGTASNVI